MEWLATHWVEITELIGKLIAALAALTASIVGLCSIIVKFVPVLAKDDPLLPAVKILGKVALNSAPVKDGDRPVKIPEGPGTLYEDSKKG